MSSAPEPQWYRSPVPADVLQVLSMRSTARGVLHLLLHALLLLATGSLVVMLGLGQHWVAFMLALCVHGAAFGFLGYAGLGHELAHRTVFADRRLSDSMFLLVSFLTWNNPVYFRKSHRLHHRFTLDPAIDGEVRVPQASLLRAWPQLLLLDVPFLLRALRIAWENANDVVKGSFGERLFPQGSDDRRRLVRWARLLLAGQLGLAVVFVVSGLWPLLFAVTLAPFFCTFPSRVLAQAQHYGMQAGSSDFRTCCRTVVLHPFLAFLYWQMNYHVEHHMYPGVPYFNLARLHSLIAADLPPPAGGLRALLTIMSAERSTLTGPR